MIIQKKTLRNILFIDIETASSHQEFHEMSTSMQELWIKKSRKFLIDKTEEITEKTASNWYKEKAAIFAEFGKIASISVGYLANKRGEKPKLRIKSFGGSESTILKNFTHLMNHHYDDPDTNYICGHNIKEFDIPFLCRRLIINGIDLPKLLNVAGKKPWQIGYLLDTLEMWKFGDYKNYTSLNLLACTLGIPSPKDDIDGSQVSRVYWETQDIERIIRYCEKDVITVVQIIMKFAGMSLIEDEQIEILDWEGDN